jgi:acyl-coenzyme A thioesterase PaaI-like protein
VQSLDRPGAEAARRRALDGVARTRAVGPHFFANFLGVDGPGAIDGRARLRLEVEPGAAPGSRVAPAALATVADLTMSAAIRDRLGPQRRLGTVTMTVHHLQPEVAGPVSTEATALRVEAGEDRGFARCELRDAAGIRVAVVDGWFVAMPAPAGRPLPPVPWELPDDVPVPPVPEADLEPGERAAVEACTDAGERASTNGTSVVEELLAMTWQDTAAGARGELAVGHQHGNRAGHVQGGIVYGISAAAARRVSGGWHLAEGHVQFLRPAQGRALHVEADVLRGGRRTVFTATRLMADGDLVATGSFMLRCPPDGT